MLAIVSMYLNEHYLFHYVLIDEYFDLIVFIMYLFFLIIQ